MDGLITGYASVFGVPDLGRDVVLPGAFAGTLARRGAAGVRMLFQHDPAEPVGRWLSLREDARGLYAEGQLNLDVQRGREIAAACGQLRLKQETELGIIESPIPTKRITIGAGALD